MKNEVDGRREIASRNTAWATIIARKLTRWGVTPNQISMMSVFFAMVGCLLLIGTVIDPGFNKYVAYILFIVCMQSRLLCNLFDGMVAIEGGKKSAEKRFDCKTRCFARPALQFQTGNQAYQQNHGGR